MQRTARNYDLILAYERDCEGGQRWSTDDIAEIRFLGRHFHQDKRALDQLQHELHATGGTDDAALSKMRSDKTSIIKYCEHLDVLIRWLEKRPRHHLLNSGEFEEVNGIIYRVVKGESELEQADAYDDESSGKATHDMNRDDMDQDTEIEAGEITTPGADNDEDMAEPRSFALPSTTASRNLPYRNSRNRGPLEDSHEGDNQVTAFPLRHGQPSASIFSSLPLQPYRRRPLSECNLNGSRCWLARK